MTIQDALALLIALAAATIGCTVPLPGRSSKAREGEVKK